jgi:Trk K+ transport system NAD-binding subunit
MGVIIINQFLGDMLFKWAVRRVGESHEKRKGVHDHNTKALIFGLENQSVALSQELVKHGWKINMITSMDPDKVTPPVGVEMIYLERLSLMNEGKLKELKLEQYDTFVLMLSDKYNYKINEYIFEHVGERNVIVRLHERSYLNDFHAFKSMVIDPSMAMVNLLEHFVRSPQATSLLLGMEPNKDTIDIEILDASYHGLALRNLRLPAEVLILSVKRKGQVLISHGYTRLRIGDIVTLVGPPEELDNLTVRFGE